MSEVIAAKVIFVSVVSSAQVEKFQSGNSHDALSVVSENGGEHYYVFIQVMVCAHQKRT